MLLLTGVPTQSKVRKDEPIVEKVTQDLYVSKGDIEDISKKLNYWFLTVLGFVALELYRAYQKRGDNTEKTLSDLVRAVERIETKLESTATKDEARQMARDEVIHYHAIR